MLKAIHVGGHYNEEEGRYESPKYTQNELPTTVIVKNILISPGTSIHAQVGPNAWEVWIDLSARNAFVFVTDEEYLIKEGTEDRVFLVITGTSFSDSFHEESYTLCDFVEAMGIEAHDDVYEF